MLNPTPDQPNVLEAPTQPALTLPANEVHLWHASLELTPSRVTELRHILSEEERARAGRFARAGDQARFTAGRGILRDILSRYTGFSPDELALVQDEHGKPRLVQPSGQLQFNVSHSSQRMLVAIADGRAVGVDLELIRILPDMMELAARFFSVREHSTLLSLAGWTRVLAFFNGWTRKEAVVKARGDGLITPLDQVEVTLAPGEPPALLRLGGSLTEAACWSLRPVDTPPEFAAVLAVEGGCERIVQRDWEG